MNICADENISPRLVEVLNSLSERAPRLLHAKDVSAIGADDRIWIRKFAEQQGDAIVTADAAISRRPAELLAVCETGLKLVILPTQYQQGGILAQTSYLHLWWPRIIELVRKHKAAGYLKLPAGTTPRPPSWQTINLQDARQRLRKPTRPSRTGQ